MILSMSISLCHVFRTAPFDGQLAKQGCRWEDSNNQRHSVRFSTTRLSISSGRTLY
jgi:hypothetical protein